MDENEFEDYERDAEVVLYREYRDIVGTFKYVIETERRFYLANEVDLKRVETSTDFYFEIEMRDASNSGEATQSRAYRCRPCCRESR